MASSAEVNDPLLGRFHPAFNDVEADVILRSSQGTLFRIPSFTLRMTSGHFRTLLAQTSKLGDETTEVDPKAKNTNRYHHTHRHQRLGPILVPFPDQPLERVLRMLSGLETSPWTSFSELEDALDLIVAWDTPGPLSIVRASSLAPVFLAHPLQLYILGTRFGWEEVVKSASQHTLSINLFHMNDFSQIQQLYRLSAKDLMRLLAFHRKRRDEFRSLLDSSEMFNAGNSAHYYCSACGEEMDNSSWRELKARMVWEMDQCASGESIIGLEMEEWEEATRCWDAVCKKDGCGSVCYDKSSTLRDITACVHRLPKTV